jgi:hypothetical protein
MSRQTEANGYCHTNIRVPERFRYESQSVKHKPLLSTEKCESDKNCQH